MYRSNNFLHIQRNSIYNSFNIYCFDGGFLSNPNEDNDIIFTICLSSHFLHVTRKILKYSAQVPWQRFEINDMRLDNSYASYLAHIFRHWRIKTSHFTFVEKINFYSFRVCFLWAMGIHVHVQHLLPEGTSFPVLEWWYRYRYPYHVELSRLHGEKNLTIISYICTWSILTFLHKEINIYL